MEPEPEFPGRPGDEPELRLGVLHRRRANLSHWHAPSAKQIKEIKRIKEIKQVKGIKQIKDWVYFA